MYGTSLIPTDGSDAAERAGDHAVGDDGEPARRLVARARGTSVETLAAVEAGRPHEAIREYAETVGVDRVVLGTHGRSGVERVLPGSVAERTFRTATRPVLVV